MLGVICDLDGTVADASPREPLIKGTNPDWAAYWDAVHLDRPVEEIHTLLLLILKEGGRIAYVTGRMERQRAATKQWLEKNALWRPGKTLLRCRRNDDFRSAAEVKQEIYSQLMAMPEFLLDFVLEDDPECVKMYRELDCLVLDVGSYTSWFYPNNKDKAMQQGVEIPAHMR